MLKNKSENMEFSLMVGIDWASEKHDYKILDNRTGKKNKGTIENTSEALELWITSLKENSGGLKIAVCLEGALNDNENPPTPHRPGPGPGPNGSHPSGFGRYRPVGRNGLVHHRRQGKKDRHGRRHHPAAGPGKTG